MQVKDWGLADWDKVKVPFYVMPLFPSTLRNLIDKKVQHNRILPLFAQMLDGIEAAHLLGVTHRDLKPENILHNSDIDSLVVADFGIAHFEEDVILTAVETRAGEKLANLRYSAPEQRIKGATVDSKADIYALGLMLNEMFTGHVPQGAGYQNIASVSEEYSYLDPLVGLMIQQLPQQRPASILEIKRELIGRKNSFVALQKLDAAKRIVVSTEQPHTVAPVRLVSADWNNGVLSLELDRIPEAGWIERFKQPRVGYTAIGYAHPHHFQFRLKTATVQADPQSVQEIINHFKQYIEMATKGYQADLVAEAAEREQEQRRQIELAGTAAQKRAEVLSKLKI